MTTLRLVFALHALLACLACSSDDEASPSRDAGISTSDAVAIPSGCPGLLAQCPPGSQPLLGVNVDSLCPGGVGDLISSSDGTITGSCEGTSASCLVVCNFTNPCECGISEISADGVFCVDCQDTFACGNGVCEGGEDDDSCLEDCNPDCEPGTVLCAASDIVECGLDGRWQRTPCRPDQGCEEPGYCATRISPTGGSIPDPIPARPSAADPFNLRFRERVIPCPDDEVGCISVGFIRRSQGVLIAHEGTLLDYDLATGEFMDTGVNLDLARWSRYAVGTNRVVTSGRFPIVNDLATGSLRTMQPFVDDTVLLETDALAISRDDSRVAAAMQLEGTNMVAVWEADTGEPVAILRFATSDLISNAPASLLALSDDGRIAIETRFDAVNLKTVHVIWNVDEGRLIQVLDIGPTLAIPAFRPGTSQVIFWGTLWDMEAENGVWISNASELKAGPVAFSPDGAVLANGGALIDAETGVELFRYGRGDGAWFDESGARLLLNGREGFLQPTVWTDTFTP